MTQVSSPTVPPRFRFVHAILIATLILLGALAIILFAPSDQTRLVLSDMLNPAVNLLAAGALYLAARRTAPLSRRMSMAWLILAIAQTCYTLGDVTWGVLEAGLGLQPFPSIADGLYVAYYPLFLIGVLHYPGPRLSMAEWVKRVLDIGIVMIAAALGFWTYLMSPLVASGDSQGWLAQALTMAYPVGDLVLIWSFLVLLYSSASSRNRTAVFLLAASILMMVVSDTVFSYQSLVGTYRSGTLLDVSWVLGYLLTGLAGVYQALAPQKTAAIDENDDAIELRSRWLTYFPYAWILIAYLILVREGKVTAPGLSDYLFIGIGAIISMAIIRQVIALQENTHLTDQLQKAMIKVQNQAHNLEKANVDLKQEIAERERVQEQLSHDATHDALTGLPNRMLFYDRLGVAIQYTRRRADCPFSVLFLDLDQFKVINDSLGHSTGDAMLVAVAHRLRYCLRAGDTVARLGGDEFAILLEDSKDQHAINRVAQRILEELKLPFDLGGRLVYISASIGVVPSVHGYAAPEDVVRDADIAMYRAKSLGKDRCEIFDTNLRIQAESRMEMEDALRRAIENQEFVLHYQPILALPAQRITGFEALLRWNHPERGLLPPAQFIPVAEETGLIVPIGQWVLQTACAQIKQWQQKFPQEPPLMVNVNISGKQLSSPDFPQHIEQALLRTSLSPASLMLEITESVLIDQAEGVNSLFTRLNELGVQFQIDDFGTGYSSLSYLRHFPIHTIKIDQTFVQEIGVSSKDTDLVHTILSMAHDLGMDAIAEGVETASQLDELQRYGCRFVQGYYLSLPLEGQAAEELLQGKVLPLLSPIHINSID